MAVEENLNTDTFIQAASIDFVNQFGKQLTSLFDMLGLHRKKAMPIGAKIKTYESVTTLTEGKGIAPGEIIPLSKVEFKESDPIELAWNKHRKSVPIEDIQAYGYEQTIARTDDELIRELQKEIRTDLFNNLMDGAKATEKQDLNFQGAVAQAWGNVQKAFEDDAPQTIVFANPLDVSDHLGEANLTIQNTFGLNYVEDFISAKVVVISPQIPQGKIYATAADNLCFAYAKVDGGEVNKSFDFVTDRTNVIGVHKFNNPIRATAETVTVSSTALFAERRDGVFYCALKAADEGGGEEETGA